MQLKIRLTFLLFLTFIFPYRFTQSCGIGSYGFSGYSFLNPDIVDENTTSLHTFMQFDDVYQAAFAKKDSAYQEKMRDENLWEWHHKFCDYADLTEIRYIIYKASIDEIISIQTAANSKTLHLDSRLAENEFAEQLRENRCLEVIDYLVFAKRCEPYVIAQDPWSEKPRDLLAMRNLIEAGKATFLGIKSPFVKLRYAFQIMRLAHYSGNYQETVNLYNYLIPKIDNRLKSVVNYWVMSLKAGALKHLNQHAEASYLFSIVFQGCLSKREIALQGFEIHNEIQFYQGLNLCKNDQEKATFYAMRGYANDAKAVEEMQLIYDLDPRNEHLESLLLREIRKSERDLLGLSFNDHRLQNEVRHKIPRAYAGEYAIRLNKFIVKCIKEKRVKNPELWLVADGYMELIRGDYYAAQRVFSKIKDNLKSETLKEQVEILDVVAQVHGFDKLTAETEEKVAAVIENPLYKKYKDLPDFLFDRLANLYENAGMKGRAFRCHHELDALKPNPQLEIIDDLLQLAQKTGKNALERHFVSDNEGNSLEDQLWEMKGVALLGENKLEAALECFKKVSDATLQKSKFNPFETRMKECITCPVKDSSKLLTRREVVERMIDLDYKSKSDLENTATHLYRLGVAHYNMSYFGHAWGVKDFYRSGISWDNAERNYSNEYTGHYYPYGNREYTDVSFALFFLERAYQIAKTREPELAARCAFWAARCRQKEYFTSNDFRQTIRDFIPQLPNSYQNYYEELNRFKETTYYQEVIKECSYFKRYAK